VSSTICSTFFSGFGSFGLVEGWQGLGLSFLPGFVGLLSVPAT
jgi:hypothetical protein